ncbi:MAG: GntR family transcriptional regulator [Salibaculum sp.]|jgi:GntR family transcriptional regulator|uniref:GntR family transcriptional regulator n=1 Tax=Roseovarius halophilus (ex Wu et al. 2025) TaxID=3376060 RepID=UPI0028700931|nr:GntR family transcriptional regulator [Salibaculum sp.]MDR9426647.1 GntR family transcriptional regulator [Salibaculum sp.]MDR9481634.1 GntR family transcriptional regulator [Salibaculum sp.]
MNRSDVNDSADTLFAADAWYEPGGGPRYLQLSRHITEAIHDGTLREGAQLPPERDLAELADVSRVTVRRAVAEVVRSGLIAQRRGAGSFVTGTAPRTEQSLSTLISFTENMKARGRIATSRVLTRGLYAPSPDEMMALGLSPARPVARLERLRSADGTPMAIERSSLPADVLPDPDAVETSLYEVLRRHGQAPGRAIQRVTAENVTGEDAALLGLPETTAILRIDRTGYLDSGRPVEFTRGLYRSDFYDFVSELRPDQG